MEQQTVIIGNREFTFVAMNPFEANNLFLKVKKEISPLIGLVGGGGTAVSFGGAIQLIAENTDETIMQKIVFPLFSESMVYCVEKKKFIKNGVDINQCFTIHNMFDLYELIFEVARYQFGPFLQQMLARFGIQLEEESQIAQSQES